MQQAIDELGTPRIKAVRPTHSYSGLLTIGNPDEYDSAICIDVQRFPRVMIRRPPTASSYVPRTDLTLSGTSSATLLQDDQPANDSIPGDSNNLANVKYARTYQVSDETAPGGKRDIDRDDLAKGYEYGRTAVHISESDYNVTKLETKQGLEIIGFIPWSKVIISSGLRSSSDGD